MKSHKAYINDTFLHHARRDDSKFVIGGVLLGGISAMVTSNILIGGACIVGGYGMAFNQIYRDSKRNRLILESGVVAPFLKGQDYQNYIDTFGSEEADRQSIYAMRLGVTPYGDPLDSLEERHPDIEEKLATMPPVQPGKVFFFPTAIAPVNGSTLSAAQLLQAAPEPNTPEQALPSLPATAPPVQLAEPTQPPPPEQPPEPGALIAYGDGKFIKSQLFLGKTRSGKGLIASSAANWVKWLAENKIPAWKGVEIWIFSAKDLAYPTADETGYWSGCDRVAYADFAGGSPELIAYAYERWHELFKQFRALQKPKILILDEFDTIISVAESRKKTLPTAYGFTLELMEFARTTASTGAGRNWAVWAIAPVADVTGLGLSRAKIRTFNRNLAGDLSCWDYAFVNAALTNGIVALEPTAEQIAVMQRKGLTHIVSIDGKWHESPSITPPSPDPAVKVRNEIKVENLQVSKTVGQSFPTSARAFAAPTRNAGVKPKLKSQQLEDSIKEVEPTPVDPIEALKEPLDDVARYILSKDGEVTVSTLKNWGKTRRKGALNSSEIEDCLLDLMALQRIETFTPLDSKAESVRWIATR